MSETVIPPPTSPNRPFGDMSPKESFVNCKVCERILLSPIAPWRTLPTREVAKFLEVKPQDLANWRYRGIAPAAVSNEARRGRPVRYRLADVGEWAAKTSSYDATAKGLVETWLKLRGDFRGDAWQVAQKLDRLGCTKWVEALKPIPKRLGPSDIS